MYVYALPEQPVCHYRMNQNYDASLILSRLGLLIGTGCTTVTHWQPEVINDFSTECESRFLHPDDDRKNTCLCIHVIASNCGEVLDPAARLIGLGARNQILSGWRYMY